MQHDLPWFCLVIPILSIGLFIQLHFLVGLTLQPFVLGRVFSADQIDHLVPHKSPSVDNIVEYRETQKLKVHSNLMSSSRDRVALEKRRVCFLVIPNSFENSPAIFPVFLSRLLLILFCLLDFWLDAFKVLLIYKALLLGCRLQLALCFAFLFRQFSSFQLRLIDLFGDPINPFFMRNTFNECRQLLFLPRKFTCNPSVVHFFHDFLTTFLMKLAYFCLVFGKYEQSAGTFVESVQDVQVEVFVLIFEEVFNGIEMVSSSSVNNDAGRFIYDQKVVSLVDDLDRQVEHRRFYSQRHMHDFISIFQLIIRCDNFVIDFDSTGLDGVLIVVRGVGLELFDEGGEERFSDPSAFGECPVCVGVGLDEPEGEPMNIYWQLFLFFIVLHLLILYYFFQFGLSQAYSQQRMLRNGRVPSQVQQQQQFQYAKGSMKESYLRSRVSLQPLNTSDFKSKKALVDYQDYEEKLSSYEKSKQVPDITDLFDWTKPSQVIHIKQLPNHSRPAPQQQTLQNNSMNTEELLRSEEGDRRSHEDIDLDDSIEVDSPSSNQANQQSYVQQIRSDYGSEYRLMSQIKLQNELKDMRERIIEMNSQLNRMLDRYELLAGTTQKKDVQIANPHKFLSKQIEINHKLIDKQLRHIKQIQEKDKQLENKDYLVELTELIEGIKKQIQYLEKQKHGQQVDVDKINKILKEIEEIQEEGEEFKEVKELKHQIVYYFKKYNELIATEEQIDKDRDALTQRESAMSAKLAQLSKVAAQNCLEVSANKGYVELKRRYDELLVSHESQLKKKEVMARTMKTAQDRLQKENIQLKKDIQKCELDIQQILYQSQQFDENSKELLVNNQVLSRELKSISYRFDQSLIHPEKKANKPDFKRVLSRMERGKTNNTIDYGAIESKNKRFSINDKNSIPFVTEGIDNAESSEPSSASRMKPILRSWKGKKESARYLNSSQKYKIIDNGSIFKPAPLLRSRK